MASLALIVGLIFLVVLLFGPFVLLLSYFRRIPNILVYILGLISIGIGLWWFSILTTSIGFVGFVPILCGIKAINYRRQTLQI